MKLSKSLSAVITPLVQMLTLTPGVSLWSKLICLMICNVKNVWSHREPAGGTVLLVVLAWQDHRGAMLLRALTAVLKLPWGTWRPAGADGHRVAPPTDRWAAVTPAQRAGGPFPPRRSPSHTHTRARAIFQKCAADVRLVPLQPQICTINNTMSHSYSSQKPHRILSLNHKYAELSIVHDKTISIYQWLLI